MLTLYYKPSCPFCQKTITAADEMGVAFNLKDISADESLREALIEKGGKQQVPYFEDPENDVAMYESDDIIAYVKENYATEPETGGVRVHNAGDNTCVACEG